MTKTDNLKKRFNLLNEIPEIGANYNILPGTENPVIVKNSPNRLVFMKWGLIPFWAKDYRVEAGFINARAEGIISKASFRKPISKQRCLVPAAGFFEWKKLKLEKKEEKIPFYIGLKEDRIFSFAGIYDVWRDSQNKDIYTYAIITVQANDAVKDIHHRMPVILNTDDENRYLDGSADVNEILQLLKPFDSKRMFSYPVSKMVNNPKNNGEQLIERANALGE